MTCTFNPVASLEPLPERRIMRATFHQVSRGFAALQCGKAPPYQETIQDSSAAAPPKRMDFISQTHRLIT